MLILRLLFHLLLMRPFARLILGINLRHGDRLPQSGPAIIIANHNNHIDTFVLMSLFPLRQLTHVLAVMTRFSLPVDYIERQAAELAALTLDDARRLLREQIRSEEMTYVVAGDAATQLGELDDLGFGKPVLLSVDGSIIP